MQIVTDCGADLTPKQMEGLPIHIAPLRIHFEGRDYTSGVDIQPDEFYQMLASSENFPTTSQPSAGEIADLYRQIAQDDPEILSIHISSGLSGTINAARIATTMVPEAKVTIVDTKTLSCPEGWQVEAAARALLAGWSLERITGLLGRISAACEGMYTLNELRYLIHGGRISHLKGLVASLLNIKPIIGVEKERGIYIPFGQEITIRRSIQKMVDKVGALYPEGTFLRIQPLHGHNPEAVALMIDKLKERFQCRFEEITPVAPVLGAHTGPSLVGLAVAPLALFEGLV